MTALRLTAAVQGALVSSHKRAFKGLEFSTPHDWIEFGRTAVAMPGGARCRFFAFAAFLMDRVA